MNELDELLGRLGTALDDGLDAASTRAADQARAQLMDAIHVESPDTVGRQRLGSRRLGGHGRWPGLLVIGLSVLVVLVVLVVALRIGGHRASSSAAVPTVLPFGSSLNPSGPTGVIASTVQLAAVVPDPEGSGPAWGIKTYRVTGDMTCFQAGREQSGQIGRSAPTARSATTAAFTRSPSPTSASAPASKTPISTRSSTSPTPTPQLVPPASHAQRSPRVPHADTHGRQGSADRSNPRRRLPAAQPATRCLRPARTGRHLGHLPDRPPHRHNTHPRPRRRIPDRGAGRPGDLRHPICFFRRRPWHRDESPDRPDRHDHLPRCTHLPRAAAHQRDAFTLARFDHCRDVGYVAPQHPKVTEVDVASPVQVQPMPARYYCIPQGDLPPQTVLPYSV